MKNQVCRPSGGGVARRVSFSLIVATVAFLLAGCGGSSPGAKSAAPEPMDLAEARAFLSDLQAKRGVPPATHTPVTSMEELLGILLGDDLARFEDAARFVEGKPGIDALTLDATVELAWGDAYSIVAQIADELGKRARVEADRLDAKRESGRDFNDADAKTLEAKRGEASLLAKARGALIVLSEDHLKAGASRVSEALRQFPKDLRTYRVAAYSYALNADWEQYDNAVRWFDGPEAASDSSIQYVRAVETMKRFGVRKQATAILEEALRLNPKLVRAQAMLVLVQEDIGEKHAELQKLRAMAPRHPVVNVAGPSIDREYEFSTSLSRARATEKPSPGGQGPPAAQ